MDVLEYLTAGGASPFDQWFEKLDPQAAAKITVAIIRIGQGNLSNVKGVSSGVFEYVLDWGPGYRVYLGKDGDKLVILLGGGTKKRQQQDIAEAKACWLDYKERKKGKA